MNLIEQKRQASKCTGKGKAYIHAEGCDGKAELMLSGDMIAIIHTTVAIVNRISEITGATFKESLATVYEMKRIGYKAFCEMLGDREYKTVKGNLQDVDTAIEEAVKEVERVAEQKNVVLTQQNARITAENERLNKVITMIKETNESRCRALESQVKELTKEITRLEHEKLAIQKLAKGE